MESPIKVLSIDQGAGIAATYARTNQMVPGVSTTTLDAQEALNVARAEALGYDVPELYRFREIASGLDTDRLVFAELYRLVASKQVQCVVVCDASRLSRDPLEVVKFLRYAKEQGVLVAYATAR